MVFEEWILYPTAFQYLYVLLCVFLKDYYYELCSSTILIQS